MITYNGLHTCNNVQRASQIIVEAPDDSTLISFEKKALIKNNTSGTSFLYMKDTPKENFLSLGHLKQEQVTSSDHHNPWDPIVGLSQVQSEPVSIVSQGLDCVDMESSGAFSPYSLNSYEINDMIESHDFGDFLSELCS